MITVLLNGRGRDFFLPPSEPGKRFVIALFCCVLFHGLADRPDQHVLRGRKAHRFIWQEQIIGGADAVIELTLHSVPMVEHALFAA